MEAGKRGSGETEKQGNRESGRGDSGEVYSWIFYDLVL
jgi:hypothetical protein